MARLRVSLRPTTLAECDQALNDARANLQSTHASLDQCKHELQCYHKKHCRSIDKVYEGMTTMWLCEHRKKSVKEHLERGMTSIKYIMMKEQSDTYVIRALEHRKQQFITFQTDLDHDLYKIDCARIQLHDTKDRAAKDLEREYKELHRLMMKAVRTKQAADVIGSIIQESLFSQIQAHYEQWIAWNVRNIVYWEELAAMSRSRLEMMRGLENA